MYPKSELQDLLREPLLHKHLPEMVVQHLWARRLFPSQLKTTGGIPLEVIHPGSWNRDSGADFTLAHLILGGVAMVGDVEVHVTSQGWTRHRHDANPRYNTVLLHVVLHSDAPPDRLYRQDGTVLHELELAPHLEGRLTSHLMDFFLHNPSRLPCGWAQDRIPVALWQSTLNQHARERLRARAQQITTEEELWQHTAASAGAGPNASTMRELARRVPLALLRSLPDAQTREAVLLFGAGWLSDPDRPSDAYMERLKDLAEPFIPLLEPLSPRMWQLGRLRPANSPELRVAQLASLFELGGLFFANAFASLRRALAHPAPLKTLLGYTQWKASPYWCSHYGLGKPSRQHTSSLGRDRQNDLLVNALLPACLSAQPGKDAEESLLQLTRRLPPENNRVQNQYALPDPLPQHRAHTQGLHHLHSTQCQFLLCMDCPIGKHVLKL